MTTHAITTSNVRLRRQIQNHSLSIHRQAQILLNYHKLHVCSMSKNIHIITAAPAHHTLTHDTSQLPQTKPSQLIFISTKSISQILKQDQIRFATSILCIQRHTLHPTNKYTPSKTHCYQHKYNVPSRYHTINYYMDKS